MDVSNMAFLIRVLRVLFVLGMIGLLVIAGALLARRERQRAATLRSDAPTSPGQRTAFMQRSLQYPANGGQAEANDAEASAPGTQRRAA